MKLDLLNSVMDKAEQKITADGLICKKYYLHKNNWYELDTRNEVSKDISMNLALCQLDVHYSSSAMPAYTQKHTKNYQNDLMKQNLNT